MPAWYCIAVASSLRRLVRPALAISAITLLSQLLSAVVQVLIAALFGARVELDAYFAALTLPTYFSAVLLGGLSYVFVPLFVEHRTTGSEEEAWKITGNIVTLYLVVAGSLTIAGMVWARQLLALTVPGLSDSAIALATTLARSSGRVSSSAASRRSVSVSISRTSGSSGRRSHHSLAVW